MGSLDNVSLVILLGSLLVLAGILSSLIAMRFGAPLLLVFLLVPFDHHRAAIGRQHEPAVQQAPERPPHLGQRAHRRDEQRLQHLLRQRVVDERRRRYRPHAARVRPNVAVADRLVILR